MIKLSPFRCPICARMVQPVTGRQRTCRRPVCVRQCRALSCKRQPVEANEAKRQVRADTFMAHLHAEFGALSDRELLLMRAVYRKAHTVGYQRGIHARRKADRARLAVAA